MTAAAKKKEITVEMANQILGWSLDCLITLVLDWWDEHKDDMNTKMI